MPGYGAAKVTFADAIDNTVGNRDGGSNTTPLTVNVAGVTMLKLRNSDSASTDVDLVLNGSGLLANDPDPDTGDTLTVIASDTAAFPTPSQISMAPPMRPT